MLSDSNVHLVNPADIKVNRDERQRKTFRTDDLEASIRTVGLLNPLIVTRDLTLVAGERRLTALKNLGTAQVPVRYTDDLTLGELRLIELEENLRRVDLTWQEQCAAITEMYRLRRDSDPTLNVERFADEIGYHKTMVHRYLDLSEEMTKNPTAAIAKAQTVNKALNTVRRRREREADNIISDLIDPAQPAEASATEGIVLADFHQWARDYRGQKFNFIHCDFPYGVGLQDSDQLQSTIPGQHRVYDDDPDIYWELLATLAHTLPNICSSSAHIMFWFSMKFYHETIDFFERRLPDVEIDPFPLVWQKTDGKGIAPDVERLPRRTYETALFGRVGDRKLVRLVNNAYGAPKPSGDIHISAKPEPVLRHFFQLCCDSHTRLLDPTCGGGSALRAAESMGATVLGLERDPEYFEAARDELNRFRQKRRLAGE